jgi:hypothetical protein
LLCPAFIPAYSDIGCWVLAAGQQRKRNELRNDN